VKSLANLETMDTSTFVSANHTWTCTLSDGSSSYLRLDGEGNSVPLKYEERDKYCEKVRSVRMAESDEQVTNKQIYPSIIQLLQSDTCSKTKYITCGHSSYI